MKTILMLSENNDIIRQNKVVLQKVETNQQQNTNPCENHNCNG